MGWTFLGPIQYDEHHNQYGLYRCDCGTERFVRVGMVKSGGSHSCGCERTRKTRERMLGEVGEKARATARRNRARPQPVKGAWPRQPRTFVDTEHREWMKIVKQQAELRQAQQQARWRV